MAPISQDLAIALDSLTAQICAAERHLSKVPGAYDFAINVDDHTWLGLEKYDGESTLTVQYEDSAPVPLEQIAIGRRITIAKLIPNLIDRCEARANNEIPKEALEAAADIEQRLAQTSLSKRKMTDSTSQLAQLKESIEQQFGD